MAFGRSAWPSAGGALAAVNEFYKDPVRGYHRQIPNRERGTMNNEEEPTHRVEWQVMSTGKMGWTGPMTLRQAEGYAYRWNKTYPEVDHWAAPLPADWCETMHPRYGHGLNRSAYLPK
jgi:hypothetical protein